MEKTLNTGNSRNQLLIKATEARVKQSEIDELEMWKKMNEAAAAGEMKVWIVENYSISEETIAKMKAEGFHVKKYHGDIDSNGHYWKGGIGISWNIIWWDRLKEMMVRRTWLVHRKTRLMMH